jgi:osmotically inducible protein OsmC
MTVRSAQALWNGTLREGDGKVRGESGFFDVPYSFGSRFEEAKGSNPEELIAAAHAGCFSMFLSAQLTKEGHPPTRIQTTAKVHLEAGPTITRIELETEGVVPGIDQATFDTIALRAKEGCPVSKALAAVETITLSSRLLAD